MNEKHFKKESNDHIINSEAIEVFNSVLEGEGSEGLRALEDLDVHNAEFLSNLQLLHMGEGESHEIVVRDLEESANAAATAVLRAVEGDTPEDRLYSAAEILRDLDRRTEEKLGGDSAIFSELDDDEVIGSIVNSVEKAVKDAEPQDDDEAYEYLNNGIESIVAFWHEGVMKNTSLGAEENYNDILFEKKQERKEKIKKFARDAGAVALGAIPIVGAMLYVDRRKK